MQQFYCGIDLGSKGSHICVIDEDDRKLVDKKIVNDLSEIEAQLSSFKERLQIVVESTFNWDWIVYGLEDKGYSVKLAHALGLKAIIWSKKKTDKWDAFTLARLLRVGMIPQAYIYPKDQRPLRDLLRERIRLVAKRASEYGAISRMLLRYNIQGYDRNDVKRLSKKDMHELYHHPAVRTKAIMHLERIELLSHQIDLIENEILQKARQDRVFHLLKDIPGIGDILALTILYEVSDINRFSDVKAFSSYCRVVPGIHQSSNSSYRSPNSKQGNRYLKWAFSQAAYIAIRYYKKIRADYERRAAKRKKAAKLVSCSIIAHKLAIAAFYVMKNKTPYIESRLFR